MIYTIYGPADRRNSFDRLVAIPESPAKWALIAPPVWLAVHRLWWPLAFYGLFVVFCGALLATELAPIGLLLLVLPDLYLFLEGRQLHRNKLETEGYRLCGIVDAGSEPAAIGHFLERNKETTMPYPQSPAPTFRPSIRPDRTEGALGLFTTQE